MTPPTAAPAPRAVIFDWDNTLVDSWHVIHRSLAVTFEAFGRRPWSLEEVRERVRASARDAFPALFGEDTDAAIRLFYDTFAANHLAELRECRGAGALLGELESRGLYLAVVSNKTGGYLRSEAEHLGWDSLFARVVGATDAPRDKPAPDPVLMALEGSGLAAGPQVWFVGDTDIDMLCAHNAGCTPILLRAEPPREQEFGDTPPTAHAADFDALRRLIG